MQEQGSDAVRDYLKRIESALKQGNATEHTHRAAMESLLEALGGPGIDAINEPRQIACGAPDFIFSAASYRWAMSKQRMSVSISVASRNPNN